MNKKLISLLVAVCLVIGLLPVASVADNSERGTATIAVRKSTNKLTVTEDGDPIYARSVAFDAYGANGASKGTGYDYTTEGADENNWNLKFEYKLNDQPTLTLKDFKLVLTDESGNPLYTDDTGNTSSKVGSTFTAVAPVSNSVIDLKIVLQGENVIQTDAGVIQAGRTATNKFNSLTIVGEEGSSLTGVSKACGIQSYVSVPITIENANIDLTTYSASNADATKTAGTSAIYTNEAAITISDSTLMLNSTTTTGNAIYAICADGTGTINVENTTLELNATTAAFNQAPVLAADGWTAVAGDDAADAVVVADAASMVSKKYVKVSYPAPIPSTEETVAPSTEETIAPSTEETVAPSTEETIAPSTEETTAPSTEATEETQPAKAEIAILNYGNMSVTEGGAPAYRTSVSKTAYNAAGEENGVYWTYGSGTEDNWNFKFEYPAGGVPTLTLKNATLDHYDDEGNLLYSKADGTTKLYGSASGILPKKDTMTDIKIILQGENHINVGYGIIRCEAGTNQYFKNVTVIGEEGSSLSGNGRTAGAFNIKAGYDLTMENVNLDIWTESAGGTAMPIGAKGGNVTINGGIIKVSNSQNCCIYADSGDIRITDAEINVSNTFGNGATHGAGAIHAKTGNLTLANCTVKGASTNGLVLFGCSGLTLHGGTYKLTGGGYAVGASDTDSAATIQVNGGEFEGTGSSGVFNKTPGISSNTLYAIKAGSSKATAVLCESVPREKYVYIGPHTHVWGEAEAVTADCAGAGATKRTCTECGAIEAYVEVAGTGEHNVVVDAAVPATCYLPGLTEGSHCGDCGKVIVEQKTVLPTGHTNLKDATLSVSGDKYTYSVYCADCDELVIRETVSYQSTEHPVDKLSVLDTKNSTCIEEGYQVIAISCQNCTETINTHTITLPVNPTAHTGALTAHPAVTPTYESDGNIAYWSCNDCGKYFADAAGTQQLEENAWILYKLCNHTGGTATCYARAQCTLCGRPYGKLADHTPDADDGDCTTPVLCSDPACRAVVTEAMDHTGGTATCIALAKCEVCDKEYGRYANHKGGEATCIALAKCDVCGEEYGSYAEHTPTPDDGDLETPILCSVCGESMGLPAEGGDIIGKPDIRYGYNNLRLTKYNEPKYLISYSYTVEDTDAQEFTAWKVTATGANEDNYNLKFYWNAGDPNPTIILRGYKWDQFNNETGKVESTKSGDEYTGKGVSEYPMILLNDLPYNIILTGEDSVIEGAFGVFYTGELSIKSEGTTKLTVNSMTGCIAPFSGTAGNGKGDKVILDANLELTSNAYYGSAFGSAVINTNEGDLVINGGTITCKSEHTSVTGLNAKNGGNIIINAGKVVAQGRLGASGTTGAVQAPCGKVIINGGTLEPVPASNNGIYALNGVEVNGGTVMMYSPMKGIVVGSKEVTSDITIKGGLVEIISSSGAFSQKPVLGDNVTGYAGDSIQYASAYDPEKSHSAKYVKLGVNVSEPDPNNAPTLPGADPNNPGENPGAPSIEPTVNPTAAPGLKLPKAVSVVVGGTTLRITKYDEPVYTANTVTQLKDRSGTLFDVVTQTITTDENNWNAKFVWPSDSAIPLLYINGLIIDDYNEETEKWRAYKQDKPEEADAHTTAVSVGEGQYMKLILTGEDSQFKTRFGINFKSKLVIESDGDTKLDLWNLSGTIWSGSMGIPLVVNANLNIFLTNYYTGSVSHGIMTTQADITVNGGDISIDFGYDQYSSAILAKGGGNIIINDGNVTARGVVGAAAGNGTIKSEEKIIVNGGTLNLTAAHAVAMYGKRGIEINGGIVNLTSPWYAINAGDKDVPAEIVFNGGTTTIIGQYACYKTPVITIGDGMYAYAGAGPRSAEVFTGAVQKLAQKPWMLITDDESKKIDIDEDDEEYEDDIFNPTEAPTESTAPTETVAEDSAATEATVPGETIPEETIPDQYAPDEEYDDNYYNVTPNLNITVGIPEYVPDGLYYAGYETADMIRDTLVEMIWAVDDYSDMFAFFDVTLMYHNGEEWVEAGEEHYPDEGYITVMLPYPVGTDIDTPFTAVHMFGSDAFGMTPGDVELLMPINTDEGILVELVGLSPVAIAWEGPVEESEDNSQEESGGDSAEDPVEDSKDDTWIDPWQDTGADEENHETGDTGVGLYIGLMVVALLGMAATVVFSNKKHKTR